MVGGRGGGSSLFGAAPPTGCCASWLRLPPSVDSGLSRPWTLVPAEVGRSVLGYGCASPRPWSAGPPKRGSVGMAPRAALRCAPPPPPAPGPRPSAFLGALRDSLHFLRVLALPLSLPRRGAALGARRLRRRPPSAPLRYSAVCRHSGPALRRPSRRLPRPPSFPSPGRVSSDCESGVLDRGGDSSHSAVRPLRSRAAEKERGARARDSAIAALRLHPNPLTRAPTRLLPPAPSSLRRRRRLPRRLRLARARFYRRRLLRRGGEKSRDRGWAGAQGLYPVSNEDDLQRGLGTSER